MGVTQWRHCRPDQCSMVLFTCVGFSYLLVTCVKYYYLCLLQLCFVAINFCLLDTTHLCPRDGSAPADASAQYSHTPPLSCTAPFLPVPGIRPACNLWLFSLFYRIMRIPIISTLSCLFHPKSRIFIACIHVQTGVLL